MNSGLLWYDKDASSNLFDAVDRAAARYYEKIGVPADTAFVNRAQLKEYSTAHRDAFPKTRLALQGKETILRNHVWLGVSKPVEVTQ